MYNLDSILENKEDLDLNFYIDFYLSHSENLKIALLAKVFGSYYHFSISFSFFLERLERAEV